MSWLPLFLFVVLFGLSMDYHVFILSRIKELHDAGASTDDAIRLAITRTAGTVTSAAIIMVAVFGLFASLSLIMMQQLGFGLAVAVLIDATVVRAVLVPATMKLLGEWNWYLPNWLRGCRRSRRRVRARGRRGLRSSRREQGTGQAARGISAPRSGRRPDASPRTKRESRGMASARDRSTSGPDLDDAVAGWRRAFRADREAVDAAQLLPAQERGERIKQLNDEVASTERLLGLLARDEHLRPQPLVVSPYDARKLLALPQDVEACVFALDGVLVPSADLHVQAWTETFDEFLLARAERTHTPYRPFDPRLDYRTGLHGRPRLDGVRAFLESRESGCPRGSPRIRPEARP